MKKYLFILCFALEVASAAQAQVKQTLYYSIDMNLLKSASNARYMEVIERESEDAKAGSIALYERYGDGSEFYLIEKGTYASVVEPRVADGQRIRYYSNGKRQSIMTYSKGELHGIALGWHDNDSLHYIIRYSKGIYDGELKTFHKNGRLKREEFHSGGKRITGWCVNEQGKQIPFFPYEEVPMFPGGEKAMFEFLRNNIRYPAGAARAGEGGLVLIDFLVDKAGNIKNIKVSKSLRKDFDTEALRVVKLFPKWSPGKLDGETVDTYYTLPVKFSMNRSSGKKK